MKNLSILYRAANDIFLSPKGYFRNQEGTFFSGITDVTYLNHEEQIKVANLIVELSKSIIEKQYGFSPMCKHATQTSRNAILVWGNSNKFEIHIGANNATYQAFGFDPSVLLHQPVLLALKYESTKSNEPSALELLTTQLKRALTTTSLSSEANDNIGKAMISNMPEGNQSHTQEIDNTRTKPTTQKVLGG